MKGAITKEDPEPEPEVPEACEVQTVRAAEKHVGYTQLHSGLISSDIHF